MYKLCKFKDHRRTVYGGIACKYYDSIYLIEPYVQHGFMFQLIKNRFLCFYIAVYIFK